MGSQKCNNRTDESSKLPLSEVTGLLRYRMKLLLTPCDCNFKDMARVERSKWMRMFKSMRHYHCGTCQQKVFAPQQLVELHGSPSTLGKVLMWIKPQTAPRR